MGKFIVDDECIQEAITELKKLRKECESGRGKSAPKNENKSKGKTFEELKKQRKSVKETWTALIGLIDQTLLFLGETNTTFKQADQQGANAIQKP